YNALEEFVYIKYKDPEAIRQEFSFIEYIFKNSQFPPEIMHGLKRILDDFEGAPIVVRSSSILEDSFRGSFSGKYKSLFIANIGTKQERMAALVDAISEVYASTFGPDPIAYRSERGLLDFREEMGILIQQVVGNKIGKYFMPSYAGVAFSNNEFSWSPRIKRKDGMLRLVAGMGTRAVDRTIDDYPKLISPGQPGLSVNNRYEDLLRYSQKYIDVINLETNSFETIEFTDLIEKYGNQYPAIEKIVSFNRNKMLVNPISAMSDFKNEDLIVTFNPLIQNTNFIKQIKEILDVLEEAYGGPVDIEFASDGKKLYMLQCRPQSHFESFADVKIPTNISDESKVFTANNYVSSGIVENIEYVVYVDSVGYSKLQTKEEMYGVGRIVRLLNRELPKGKFILIGPGRWGSKGDIKLGVPVISSDIINTAMLIEVAREKGGYVPELSFGTHFFQDLVEANIRYLPLYPDIEDNLFNEDFLMNSENHLSEFVDDVKDYESFVKLIKVSDKQAGCSMSIFMDGEENDAVAFIC
ncbi:MAG: pyruvate, phosphate dikinase, partial [Candidatus Kapabacteria bacterium]|nr:pyruvate, phosphate dikinase [Candidatus Kapabacteria bacterium]